jgi:hypothetical protein
MFVVAEKSFFFRDSQPYQLTLALIDGLCTFFLFAIRRNRMCFFFFGSSRAELDSNKSECDFFAFA